MNVLMGIAIILGLAIAVILAVGAFHLSLNLWYKAVETAKSVDDLRVGSAHERLGLERQKLAADKDRLELDRQRLQVVEKVYPDPQGNYPILWDGSHALDPNRAVVFSITGGAEVVTPALSKPEQLARILRAAGWPSGAEAGKLLGEPQQNDTHWPAKVTLGGLMDKYNIKPSMHNIVLGEAWQGDDCKPVIGDMQDMVHLLISGGSGFGKSTLLEAIAKQLVLADDCDLCAVDYGVNTLSSLAGHFLYPIADEPSQAIALFQVLLAELERRRGLMRQYGKAKDLQQYNAISGDDLRPITCLVDESASLFQESGTRGPATRLAQMGRKYGIGLCFAGTDFKSSTLPTEATGNFGLRLAFHLRPSLSQSILFCRDASDLKDRGRALAILPGTPGLTRMQCPIVERWDDLPTPGEVLPLPEVDYHQDNTKDQDVERRIRELAGEGLSKRKIQLEVFGYSGGRAFDVVSSVLSDTITTPDGDTASQSDNTDS